MGDCFQINASSYGSETGLGGGAIHWRGGSIILGNSTGPGTDFYLFKMTSARFGDLCSMSDVRIEMRGDNAKLVSAPDTGGLAIRFNGVTILDASTATKDNYVSIGRGGRVSFSNVHLKPDNPCLFKINAAGYWGWGGSIQFDEFTCDKADFATWCSVTGFAGGSIQGRRMRGVNNTDGLTTYANDFQISAAGASGGYVSTQTAGYGGTSDVQPRRKLAYIKNFAQYWPSSVGDEKRLILPPGAVVTGVFGKFSASGFSGLTNAYLRVTNDDYSVLFASLSIGAGATGGDFNVQNLLYALGSTATLRTLRLSIGANSASASVYTGISGSNGGGFLAIEYI